MNKYKYILGKLFEHDTIKHIKEKCKDNNINPSILVLGNLDKSVARMIRKHFYTADVVFTQHYIFPTKPEKIRAINRILPQATIAYPVTDDHEIYDLNGNRLRDNYSLIIDIDDDIVCQYPKIWSSLMIKFYYLEAKKGVNERIFRESSYSFLQEIICKTDDPNDMRNIGSLYENTNIF